MAPFKFVISEPSTRKSFQKEVDQAKAISLVGKKIGDEFTGDTIDLLGYTLQITGGTDKDGFPMRMDIEGQLRKRFLITKGIGFHADVDGLRRRKMLRGNTIADDISQINCKVVKQGSKPLDEIFGKKEEAKAE